VIDGERNEDALDDARIGLAAIPLPADLLPGALRR
jgi:hypothetical protein